MMDQGHALSPLASFPGLAMYLLLGKSGSTSDGVKLPRREENERREADAWKEGSGLRRDSLNQAELMGMILCMTEMNIGP